MIHLEDAIRIHNILIDEFGGKEGIRDKKSLESALYRPYQTFSKKSLYPDIVDKAAALIESILLNHPFIDGNKRTGYVLMRLLLLNEGLDISASQDDKYEFVMAIAKGEYDHNLIKDWISNKLTSITR